MMKINYRLLLYLLFIAGGIFVLEQFRIDNIPDPNDVIIVTIEGNGETVDI